VLWIKRCFLLGDLLLRSTSEEIEALCIHESVASHSDWSSKLNVINGVSCDVDAVCVLLGEDEGVVALEVEDGGGVDVLTDLKASVVDLVEFDQVALVVAVNREVLNVNDTKELSLSALGVHRKD
jgi:hypothetical protein